MNLAGQGKVLQKTVYALNQRPVNAAVSSIARIHGCRNQCMEMGVASLIIITRHPLANFLPPLPAAVWSAGLEVSNDWVISGSCGLDLGRNLIGAQASAPEAT